MPNSLNYLKNLTEQLNLRDAELRYRNEQLERVLSSCPDPFFIFKGQTIVDCNERAAVVLCYSREELIGKTVLDMVSPEDRDETLYTHKTRDGETRDGSIWFTNRWVCKDGTLVTLQWSGWQDENDEIYSFARVKTEQEMVQEELSSVLLHAMEMTSGLVAIADHTTGFFLRVSRGWGRVLGWTEEELTSQPWTHFVHPDDLDKTVEVSPDPANSKASSVASFRNRYRHKNGEYVMLEWAGALYGRFSYAIAHEVI